LVRTSNPGAGIWQNAGNPSFAEVVADWLAEQNAAHLGDCGLGPFGAVIGATLLDEAPKWRSRLNNAWLLVPGYGAQGAKGRDITPHFR
jgi:orotidine-5'-phosphate decarboxylase